MKTRTMTRITVACAAVAGLIIATASATTPALVPWPAAVVVDGGSFVLGNNTRIVPAEPALVPLANVLAGEFQRAFKLTLAVDSGAPAAGNIRLQLTGSLASEAQRVTVTTAGAVVEAGNYHALAAATVTLLQAVAEDGGGVAIPCLSVTDQPFVAYRGLLIDVARQPHSVDTLKKIIQLCRLYKIRYLQLHLTDDQGFKFPSTAYPLLTTQNYSGPAYTLADLADLESYSQERGVTIIPELEIPGHSAAMNRTMPDLFKIKDTLPYEHHATVNWAKPEVMEALDTLIGEICAVFQATPYFHVGGDEADFTLAHQNAHFIQRFRELGYAEPFDHGDSYQLYRRLLRTLSELVGTKYHKQMLCWEGFHRDESPAPLEPVPKTIPVMAFENTYYPANNLVADGYPVINSAWNPLYVVNNLHVSPENIYGWNIYQFGRFQADWSKVSWVTVPPGSNVIGAQMCSWEQPENIEINSLRIRLAAMSERIWNPDAGKTFADFSTRVAATDDLLSRLAEIDAWAPKVEISGSLTAPLDSVVGAGNSARLVGDTKTYWASTTSTSNVDLNGFKLTLHNGGGNAQTYNGTLTGPGTLQIDGRSTADWDPDIRLGGTTANTPAGVLLNTGRLTLNKSPGVDAIAGAITMSTGSNTKRIWLQAADQIHDASTIDSGTSTGQFILSLNGHHEGFASLTIKTGDIVHTGTGGVLNLATLIVNGNPLPKGAYTAGTHSFVQGTGYIDVDNSGPPVIVDPPAAPANPAPAEAANTANPAYLKQLTWNVCNGATSYEVFLWQASASKPANPTATVLSNEFTLPSALNSLTSYNWQVIAVNQVGSTAGPTWTFTTVARWELSGNLPEPLDAIIGAGNSGLLTGNTQTYWAGTTSSSSVNLNGFQLTLDNGGGNAQAYNGTLTGPGTLRINGRSAADWDPDIRLGGTTPNTPSSVILSRGRATLDKPAGVDALAGPITIAASGDTKRIWLLASDQIHDASTIDSTASSGLFEFVLNGFSETVAGLTLASGHRVNTGNGGVLTTAGLTVSGTPVDPGTYSAATSPGFISGTGSVVVAGGTGGAFDAWAATKGLNGPAAAFDADPDGDGIPNGIEFVIGSEPNPAHPDSHLRTGLPDGRIEDDNFVITYHRTDEAAYLNPTVEFDTNLLGMWTTAVDPGNATISVLDGTPVDIVMVAIPRAGNTSIFGRLTATAP